jgi:hypothetical protein
MSGMGKESEPTIELNSGGLVVSQNGNFVNGDYVFAAHDGAVNAVNPSPGVLYAEVEAAWQRDWYVDKTGAVNVKLAFDLGEGINGDYPANIDDYRLLYKLNQGDDYDTISVAGRGVQNGDQIYFSVDDAQFNDGYYTLGTINQTDSPLDGVAGRTWYTLISGDWDTWEVWTLDPSGALPNNPQQLTPTTSPTAHADNVVVLTGKNVTVSTNNKTHNKLTVDGRLDFQSTSGHSFGEIKGRGRMLLSGDNFPSGDATHFITEGKGEGTVVYYGSSDFDLSTAREFYNLEIDMDDASSKLTLLNDYNVNGYFRLKNGTFQINDNSSTTNLNINVTGDVNVESNASILTGTGNARHQLNLYGDFTNQGTVAFTNRTSATYGSQAINGIVDVNFLNDSKNQTAFLDGPSTFYRIEIDKGTDDTYELSLEATDAANFKLYGYAGESHGENSQLTENDNALGLIKGTVRIKSNVSIPVLNNIGNYNVSESARLWVDGGFVAKNNGTAIVPYGKIQVSSGTLEAKVESGITIRGNGLVKVEGGTLTINQLRTSVFGATNVGGYVQSGGTTNIMGGNTANDYYCFNLTYPGNVFNMSGGTLHIHEAHGKGGIFIASSETNYNVSGGTVIIEISDGNDFPITSTAPFWNATIRNSSSGTGDHILSGGTDVGATNENLAAQPLKVLNDLTIEADAFLNHAGNDLYVGHDFYIDENAQTRTFDNSGFNDSSNDFNIGYLFDPAIPNNTIFDGSEDGEFYIGYNNADGFEEYFHDVTIRKTKGSKVTLVCSERKTAQYLDDNNRSDWYARLLRIENNLSVESGIFDQGQSSLRLYGPVNINADAECGVWIPGTTHPWAVLMLKDADLNINTEKGAVLGSVKMNPNPQTDIISFSSDVYIKRIAYFHGRINLQSYQLKLDYLHDGLTTNNYDISDGNSNDEMFYSSGNASDGSLMLYIPSGTADGTAFPFPLGVFGKYTPAEIVMSNVVDDGYIKIIPVDKELQTTSLGSGDILQFYWKVDYQDFDNIPTVDRLRFFYNNGDISGSESNYVAGKVLDVSPFSRSYEDMNVPENEGIQTSNNRITFNGQTDAGFPLEKASYTGGVPARFTGSPEVFYLRANSAWNNGNTWSYSRGGGAAGDYPKAGDVAVIRRLNTGYSGLVTVSAAEQAAAVIFDDENGWASGSPRIIFSASNNYAAYNSVFDVVDVADTHEGGTLDYNTHGAVVQYNINQNYSNENTSLEFDGVDDYVAIQNHSYNGDSYQEMTVEAWIKTDDGSDQVIASFDRNQYWRLEVNGEGSGTGQIGFDIMTDAGQLDFGGSTRIDDGQWHHVVGVFDNGNVYIYVDGVLDNSTTSGTTFGTAALSRFGFVGVGSEADTYNGTQGPTSYFDGNIAEVRIWNVARTATEIQNSRNSALVGTETGLEVYYKMNGTGTDNITSDDSSNGNTGSLFGYSLPGAWVSDHPWGSSFPGGDFGGFNRYPNALVIYQWDGASSNADVTLSAEATEYPQMWFSGGNGNRKLRFPNTDVTIHGGFTVPGSCIIVGNGDSNNTITMEQNVNIGSPSLGYGQFLFPGNATGIVTLDVKKNVSIRGGANSIIGIENAVASNTIHKFIVEGNFNIESSGGKLRLGDGDLAKSNVEFELQGASDNVFANSYGSDTPQFYRIIMNKGLDATNSFSFDSNFALTGSTDGVGISKAIELQNGRLILNNNSVNVNLSTGDDLFYIPGTSALEIAQGQANVSGGSGILLDGLLEVSGGNVDMSGGDNYIQYSASGNATIDVSSGNLIVGSQIRRGLTSSEGILNYSQSGGTVVVGNDAAPEDDRGVLEVLNANSQFNLTGGDLYIARAQDNPGAAALYLDPATSNVDAAANIYIGHTNTPANQTMGIYSNVDLPNLTVDNNSTNTPVAQIWTVPLTVNNNLDIQSGASFDANGLDLILNGDISANGAFVANNNTTFFSSNGAQQITGSPVFYNVTKDGSGTLSLNNDVTINNVFSHQSGVLSDNSNTLSVKGNLEFDGDHSWGGSGNGIQMNGSEQQTLQGSGAFGKLTINNPAGIFVPEGNTININGDLQLDNGVLDIGKNLLELTADASIIEGNAFSEQNMIQTNISFTDAGVKKWFPAISSATTFIYPIGSAGKYTPVEFNIDNLDAGGYIRVKAADELHPTVVNDDEPCNNIIDSLNVLKYHWVLETGGISNLTGSASMKYYGSDVQIDNSLSGTSYDVSDYITARLLRNSTEWNKYDPTSFDQINELLTFQFSSTDDNGVSGSYTAGVEDTGGSCEGAIPDEVPVYITVADGIWGNASIWDTYPISGGSVPAGGPRGTSVIIGHDVNITNNYKVSYRTEIAEGGRLSVGSTFGHRLGEVTGQGTLSLLRGDLPAGVYEDFLSASGGTLEYGGSNDYDVLSENTFVNNLRFIGSGSRRLPNLTIQAYGDIELDGPSLINEHNRTLLLNGDFVFDSGSFDAGTGPDAKLILNGNATQNIGGLADFSSSNNSALNRFEVNNSAGVLVESDVEVETALTLTDGVINNSQGNRFAVLSYDAGSVSGGSSSSYVWGPFEKSVNTNGSFVFPVGDNGRYGSIELSETGTTSAAVWETQYYNHNPGNDGFDPNSMVSPVVFVSNNEYWRINAPEATDANVTIRWDSQSGVSADANERDDLRLVTWNNLATDAWAEAGSTISDGGQNSGTIKSNTVQSFNKFTEGNYFTLGGVFIYTYSWEGDVNTDWFTAGNWADNSVPSAATEVTIPENPLGSNDPVIDGDAFCKDLSIEPNATVTLNAGATLNIVNSFVNNGDVILKSTPDAVASLNVPVGNTDSGHGIIELSDVMGNQWYRFGQPVSNPTGAIYDASVGTSWVYRSTTSWQRITSDANVIDPMEGIMVLYESAHVIDYEGTLNTGDMSWSIPYGKGYYLFANPYPSSIKWDIDDMEDTGITISDNLSSTIYYRIYAGSQVGDYLLTYNGTTGVSAIEAGGSFPGGYTAQNMGNISPLQSVWVKVNVTPAGNATIDLTNKARIADNSLPLKSASASSSDRYILRLMQTNAYISDVAVICFSDKFGAGMERADSEKMFNTSKKVPEIYTRVDDKSLVINGLPALTAESYSMPVSVKNQELVEVELSIRLDEFTDNYDVLIEDKVTGVWTDFREVHSYRYMPNNTGNVHDRFVLHLNPVLQVPTDVVDIANGKTGDIQITSRETHALVTISRDLLNGKAATIDLMDINGRLISSQSTKEIETEVQLPDVTAVYVVKVMAGGQQRTDKVLVNRQ